MAGYPTTFYTKRILDHSTGVQIWTPPATLYVAATTAVLSQFDVVMPSGVEMSGSGYARAAIQNTSGFWSSAALDVDSQLMTSKNVQVVNLGTATADWPPLPGWAILDDPNPQAGNIYWSGSFTQTAGFCSSGQTAVINIGNLQLVASGPLS